MNNLQNLRYSNITPHELEQRMHHGRQLRAEALASAFEILKSRLMRHGSPLSASSLSGTGV
jgi:hypothetical protein